MNVGKMSNFDPTVAAAWEVILFGSEHGWVSYLTSEFYLQMGKNITLVIINILHLQ